MNLGEFRLATALLPAETEILEHGGDAEYSETSLQHVLPADTVQDAESDREQGSILVPAIIIAGGQPVWIDLEIDRRIDDKDSNEAT